MKILILTEGGKKYGFGHITRCLAIYQELKSKFDVRLVVDGDSAAKDFLGNVNVYISNWHKDTKKVFKLIGKNDAVIIDSYKAGPSFCKELSGKSQVSLYIDDNNRLRYPRGVVVNGNIYAKELEYPRTKGMQYLLGTDYVCLRKDFLKIPSKRINKQIRSIMLTYGGSSNSDFTAKTLRFLSVNYPGIHKLVVVPEGFKDIAKLECAKDSKTEFMHSPDAKGMIGLMLKADICICGGGQTINELARIGVPTVGICFADNQRLNLKTWQEKGFIKYIGHYKGLDLFDNLKSALENLSSQKVRTKMSKIGRKFVDGKGSRRITEQVLGAYADKN